MLRQQNSVVTPHLGHPPTDPALGAYWLPNNKKTLSKAPIVPVLRFSLALASLTRDM